MLCATHVQFDELNNTKNKTRRDELLHVFETIIDSSLETESSAVGQSRVGFCKTGETFPTESSVYGNSKYGQSKYTDTNSLYELIYKKLREVNSRKNKEKNHRYDALISETAIKNNFTLVFRDTDLNTVLDELGYCNKISLESFVKENS